MWAAEEIHERTVCVYMCMNLSFACIWCNYPCTHARTSVSMHVCRADQMPCSGLQGALISCVFTVTDTQQSEARPAAGQAGMNGTAYKGQHPQGSQLTHQLKHYTHSHSLSHTHTLVWPVSTDAKSIQKINPLSSLLKVQLYNNFSCLMQPVLNKYL